MFTPRRTTQTKTWVEFHITISESGKPWKDVFDAINWVHAQYIEDNDERPFDDSIRVLVGDDEIILRYEKKDNT